MSIKITIPNSSSDVLTFGSGNTPTAAQIAGIDSGSSNGQLALYTTASGTSTERVRINASGNVGIGTSSPSGILHTYASNGVNYFESPGVSGVSLQFKTNNTNRGRIGVPSGVNALAFWTDAGTTEAMRIDSSGNLLVGATTTQGGGASVFSINSNSFNPLQVQNTHNSDPYGAYFNFSAAAPNNTVRYFLYCSDTGGARTVIRSNGGLANYSANNVNLSDRREKTNFAPAGDYLAKICAIPVQTFNYIDQNMEEDGGLTLGVVAQDVQAVAPEMVMESNWGTEEEPKMRLSIYQTDLQYALMKCIQEQQAIITSLTDRITALENK